MSTYREMPCKYYLAYGSCEKGREASFKKYCQHCDKYVARAHKHFMNKKRELIEKERGKIIDY